MTGLLVSVRSAEEARIALLGGANVVDVKEPRNGALGAADVGVWRDVLEVVNGRATTSVALGELLSGDVDERARQTDGFRFAKIGLAGCGRKNQCLAMWQRAVENLPVGVQEVPVAYADWQAAAAPQPLDILPLAERSAARMMLIDTFEKCSGDLLAHLPPESLRSITVLALRRGVRLALAGSLGISALERVLELAPAYVGVRGAACAGGRDGALDLACVKSLVEVVRRSRRLAAS
jgi:uncharacterized protein (UPF0264 family)